MRGEAAHALGHLGAANTTNEEPRVALEKRLGDLNPYVRHQVARALGTLGRVPYRLVTACSRDQGHRPQSAIRSLRVADHGGFRPRLAVY